MKLCRLGDEKVESRWIRKRDEHEREAEIQKDATRRRNGIIGHSLKWIWGTTAALDLINGTIDNGRRHIGSAKSFDL